MRHLVTLSFLAVAVVLAITGSASGCILFLLAALFFEGVVWYRILRKPPTPTGRH